jgi:2-polyprenyl-3-methyl-5-hydroxy-6-metoxy-1,4-benzoquinol methylase
MERFTNGWFENLLLQEWLPKVPSVQSALEAGASVVDVGCGAGRACIKLAQAFPNSTIVGLDAFQAQVDLATANAQAAGVADRVRFEVRDVAADGTGSTADVITTFDVVHDAVDPRGLLRAIRQGLDDGGTYLMLEMNAHDDPAENVGPIAAMLYGVSVMYCMTTSLAHGGEGLGTCGMPPGKVRELSLEAGFGEVEQVEMENPFNTLFAIRA